MHHPQIDIAHARTLCRAELKPIPKMKNEKKKSASTLNQNANDSIKIAEICKSMSMIFIWIIEFKCGNNRDDAQENKVDQSFCSG